MHTCNWNNKACQHLALQACMDGNNAAAAATAAMAALKASKPPANELLANPRPREKPMRHNTTASDSPLHHPIKLP